MLLGFRYGSVTSPTLQARYAGARELNSLGAGSTKSHSR